MVNHNHVVCRCLHLAGKHADGCTANLQHFRTVRFCANHADWSAVAENRFALLSDVCIGVEFDRYPAVTERRFRNDGDCVDAILTCLSNH